MDPDEKPKQLRPTQIAVIVTTAFLMALTALLFGYGLYCILNPSVITSGDAGMGRIVGPIVIACALFPGAAIWGMWMLWNDLARRTPGSAKKFPK